MTRIFGSPGRYVQGQGVIDSIEKYLSFDGSQAALLLDEQIIDIVAEPLGTGLAASGFTVESIALDEVPTDDRIDRIVDEIDATDVVVGAGGGRTLDITKAVAARLETSIVTVPTIASTDAPTSSLSVIYTEAGDFETLQFHGFNPDLVVVDTELIAAAPTRLFRSGIADALATWFEADTAYQAHAKNVFEGHSTRTAHAIAREAYETITEHGVTAVTAVEQNAVTPSVEAVVEANTLMSGLGFESGGLAAAHAIHDGLTHLDLHGATHGEKVNLGTITQLVLEGRPKDELHEFIELSIELGLPVTLEEIGLTETDAATLRRAAEAACEPVETIHNEPFEVTPSAVVNALETADRVGRTLKDG
ncbi:iron-containing alcohol dehydrogenase [Natronomonas sp. CBA1123]|uniref:glycerol dehydrogenase n=1 Tax=Natronomonas sp. CBA1123 TaxID=2668070 RepID=UPI0013091E64|nr:iron-containing alcohol dehydrogenase [Natronomonas sp. CBA1123]